MLRQEDRHELDWETVLKIKRQTACKHQLPCLFHKESTVFSKAHSLLQTWAEGEAEGREAGWSLLLFRCCVSPVHSEQGAEEKESSAGA